MEAYRNVSNGNCVEEWLLQHYVNGHLPQSEKERIERHVHSCEMCLDEVEGMKLIAEHKRKMVVERLEEKLFKKYINSGKSRKLTAWVVAAACVAGILGTVVFYFNQPADIAIPVAQAPAEKVNKASLVELDNNGMPNNAIAAIPEEDSQDENVVKEEVAETQEIAVVDEQPIQEELVEEEFTDEVADVEESAPAFDLNSGDAMVDDDDSLLLAFNEEPNFKEEAGVTRGKKLVKQKTEFEIQLEKYIKDSSNCLLVQRLLDMAQIDSDVPSITRFSNQLENLGCNE